MSKLSPKKNSPVTKPKTPVVPAPVLSPPKIESLLPPVPEPVVEVTPEPIVVAIPEPTVEVTPEPVVEVTPEPVVETKTVESLLPPAPVPEPAKPTSPPKREPFSLAFNAGLKPNCHFTCNCVEPEMKKIVFRYNYETNVGYAIGKLPFDLSTTQAPANYEAMLVELDATDKNLLMIYGNITYVFEGPKPMTMQLPAGFVPPPMFK
jgi:hypothetical protein